MLICSICNVVLMPGEGEDYWGGEYVLCPDCYYDFIDVEADMETDIILLKKLKNLVTRARTGNGRNQDH